MSRAALLYGDQTLLDEYNDRVAEKLNTKSCAQRMNLSDITEAVLHSQLKKQNVPKTKLGKQWKMGKG